MWGVNIRGNGLKSICFCIYKIISQRSKNIKKSTEVYGSPSWFRSQYMTVTLTIFIEKKKSKNVIRLFFYKEWSFQYKIISAGWVQSCLHHQRFCKALLLWGGNYIVYRIFYHRHFCNYSSQPLEYYLGHHAIQLVYFYFIVKIEDENNRIYLYITLYFAKQFSAYISLYPIGSGILTKDTKFVLTGILLYLPGMFLYFWKWKWKIKFSCSYRSDTG